MKMPMQARQNDLGEYLEERFEDNNAVIRTWDNGYVELNISNPDMSRNIEEVSNESLPGWWEIDNVEFARRGITIEFEENTPESRIDELMEWVREEADQSGIKQDEDFPLTGAKVFLAEAKNAINEYKP